MPLIELIEEIGISGFLDIAFMTVLIYTLLVWFKRTRTAFVVIGMSIVGAAYLLARQLDLSLTTTVFQGFFAIILIAIVIIFQEEIKRFFEQIASRSFVRNFRWGKTLSIPRRDVDVLITSLNAMARDHVGALIVVRGRDPIQRHLEGGVDLDGEMSEAVVRSIFDPHSLGHDGALIMKDGRISQFSAHLPLSKNLRKLRRTGTRHAAALGLAEVTDALCLVVSEEEGTISIARNGDLQQIFDAEELRNRIEQFYQEILPQQESRPWRDFFKRNYKEKAFALVATFILWFFFVLGAKTEFQTFMIPIEYNNIPAGLVVGKIEPQEVEITFSAPKRSFYLVRSGNMRVFLKLFDTREGTNRRAITRSNVTFPEGLTLENIQPNEVYVHITRAEE